MFHDLLEWTEYLLEKTELRSTGNTTVKHLRLTLAGTKLALFPILAPSLANIWATEEEREKENEGKTLRSLPRTHTLSQIISTAKAR